MDKSRLFRRSYKYGRSLMHPLSYMKLIGLGTLIAAIFIHDEGLLIIGFSAILWAEIRGLRP